VIDLHSHTTHSDGDRSPAQLFAEAAAAGVTVLSVTDHDTVSGLGECAEAARSVSVRLIPGIELSCDLHGREIHLLGHFLDPEAQSLHQMAEDLLLERRERMERMVRAAQALGMKDVTLEKVIACSGGENLGRPHLARVLIESGHASGMKDAFEKFLRTKGPLWVDRRRLTVQEAVRLVHGAGGTVSCAHPGANGVSRNELRGLAESGVDAVEAYHPEHPPNQAAAYQRWAEEAGMLVTAGSDYHGPSVQPDRKLGDRYLAADRFAALEQRAAKR
jgi:predicted metal-dependent phosphoesterase TrpH